MADEEKIDVPDDSDMSFILEKKKEKKTETENSEESTSADEATSGTDVPKEASEAKESEELEESSKEEDSEANEEDKEDTDELDSEEEGPKELSDEEFMEKRRSKNIGKYKRFEGHRFKQRYKRKSDWEEIISNPMLIVICITALLGVGLLVAISLKLRNQEDLQALKGYVLINKKLPKDWGDKEVGEEVKEILDRFEQERHHKSFKHKIIDKHENAPARQILSRKIKQ